MVPLSFLYFFICLDHDGNSKEFKSPRLVSRDRETGNNAKSGEWVGEMSEESE